MTSPYLIEPLAKQHVRDEFDCGNAELNTFLRKYARQNEQKGLSRTYVAVRQNARTVCGYYSLSSSSVEFVHLPEDLQRRYPRYPIPVAHFGRLAVDRREQGRGLGAYLLIDALLRVLEIADQLGIAAVEVKAIDEEARRFYLKYGFKELKDDHRHLYMPVTNIKKLPV